MAPHTGSGSPQGPCPVTDAGHGPCVRGQEPVGRDSAADAQPRATASERRPASACLGRRHGLSFPGIGVGIVNGEKPTLGGVCLYRLLACPVRERAWKAHSVRLPTHVDATGARRGGPHRRDGTAREARASGRVTSADAHLHAECELVFTFVTPGVTANGPVCLESLPYPGSVPRRRSPGSCSSATGSRARGPG